MSELRCSIFENAWDDYSTRYVPVRSILKAIRDGRWKDDILKIRETKDKTYRDKLKLKVPGACFSGTFLKKSVYNRKKAKNEFKARMDSHIQDYTGIVIIDIDIKDTTTITRLRNMLPEDPYVYSFFISPSGGLKVLYIVDSKAEDHKSCAYEQIKSWVEDNYGIEVDRSGKNISRLCYISYDPDLYFNPDYLTFEVDTTKKEEEEFVRPAGDFSHLENENNIDEVYKTAKGWLASNGDHYVVGNRNNYMHKIACTLNRSGLYPNQIMNAITRAHSINRKTYDEIENTVKMACQRNSHEFGSRPIKSNRVKKFNDLTSF